MESFETVGSVKLRYQEWGADKSASPSWFKGQDHNRHLLFIHGLGSSSDRWLDIPQALSLAGFHSIALNLPGFGGSDRPSTNYTIDYFAKMVADFMRQKQLEAGDTSLIGHSLGGYIAAQLAAERDVDRLVLIDTSGMLKGSTPLLQEYASAAAHPSKESVRKVLEKMVADPIRIPEALVDGFLYRITQQGAQPAFQSAYENSVNSQLGIEKLKRISCPTLIVWGMKDNLIPIEYYHIFREAIGNASYYLVQDAGHAPFAEKPAVVCELLRMFLEP